MAAGKLHNELRMHNSYIDLKEMKVVSGAHASVGNFRPVQKVRCNFLTLGEVHAVMMVCYILQSCGGASAGQGRGRSCCGSSRSC